MATPADRPDRDGPAAPPTSPSSRAIRRLRGATRIAATRLRFLVVVAGVAAIIGGWEAIRGHWLRWTTGPASESATSSDTEFFCPMDPGVLSDWPSKCPVCNMSLVRRRRGEPVPLPDGVMARMQFSPYRLALGGIRTEAIDFAPLARTLDLPGVVREATRTATLVEADVFARELCWIGPDQAVEVMSPSSPAILPGKVLVVPHDRDAGSIGKLVATIKGRAEALRVGDGVAVRVRCPVDRLEPFASLPTSPPPLGSGEARRLFACMDHADVVRQAGGRCPRDGLELLARPLRDDQRVRWWCPLHAGVTADQPGSKCAACGGMVLVPRVVSYRPPGSVLAVPGPAVLDDGSRSYVYVDRGSGLFDARVVTLGPRCGAMFPIAAGLEPGDRVAAQGAFLIDAETRLDPSLAAGYFGAAGATKAPGPIVPAPTVAPDETWLSRLEEADRPRATRQGVCPVTGRALGSMGVPRKLTVRGRVVFLCCAGCVGAVEAEPGRYLAQLAPGDEGLHP